MRRFFVALACFVALSAVSSVFAAQNMIVPMKHGAVATYKSGELVLHVYRTEDPLNDHCFMVETPSALVVIESPAFADNIDEWKNYIAGLNKPVTDAFLSYHPNGGKWYGDATCRATDRVVHAIDTSAVKQMIDGIREKLGDGFSAEIPPIDRIVPRGKNTFAGVDFEIIHNGDGYDIAIPAFRAIYVHMLGADTHSILFSTEMMDETIATMERYLREGYCLVLTSHHAPETGAAFSVKIDYIKKTKAIAAASIGKADFIESMKKAFPGMRGENYLEMTANALFKW